jgi:hypothetical protein
MDSTNDPGSFQRPGFPRRKFLKMAGVVTVGAFAPEWVFAGPFQASDFGNAIPADKKLSPEWVKSLTDRGNRTEYRGKQLAKIGMPIGGICAGGMYLGGDGRLWLWDIFNANHFGIKQTNSIYLGQSLGSGSGSAYVDPPDQMLPSTKASQSSSMARRKDPSIIEVSTIYGSSASTRSRQFNTWIIHASQSNWKRSHRSFL